VFVLTRGGWTHTHSNKHARAHKWLTVMYFTSMSVFLSSSDIISLWNLLNFRRRRGRGRRGRGNEEKRGKEDTLVILNFMRGWSATSGKSQRQKCRAIGERLCGRRAKSNVALVNESEPKRGNAHRLLSFSLELSPISVRVSECLLSLDGVQWRPPN